MSAAAVPGGTSLRVPLALLVLTLAACASNGPRIPQMPPQELVESLEPEEPTFAQRVLAGDRQREVGDVAGAAWEYFRALGLNPGSAAPRERIAYLHLRSGDPTRARAIFRELVQKNPKAPLAHAGLGLAYIAGNQLTDAEPALRQALEIDPDCEIATLALGILADWNEHHAEARAFYTRALQINPGNPTTHLNLGVSYLMTREFSAAAETLQRAIELNPTDAAAYNNLGLALGRTRDYPGAFQAFRAVADEADARNNLGYVCYLNGDYEVAIENYEAALEAQPADPLTVVRNLRRAQAARVEGPRAQPARSSGENSVDPGGSAP